jgi:hypothetical protein
MDQSVTQAEVLSKSVIKIPLEKFKPEDAPGKEKK